MKRFFRYGFSSGTRFRSPARGYDIKKEVMSLTVTLFSMIQACRWHKMLAVQ